MKIFWIRFVNLVETDDYCETIANRKRIEIHKSWPLSRHCFVPVVDQKSQFSQTRVDKQIFLLNFLDNFKKNMISIRLKYIIEYLEIYSSNQPKAEIEPLKT